VAARKSGPFRRRHVSEHYLEDGRNPRDDGRLTRSWRARNEEELLEYTDEDNVGEQEPEDEQATTPVEPPSPELVASDVEHATSEKEKPDIAELGEYREANESGI
jgi:hypothetical protein